VTGICNVVILIDVGFVEVWGGGVAAVAVGGGVRIMFMFMFVVSWLLWPLL
jgi:hypothetical protein